MTGFTGAAAVGMLGVCPSLCACVLCWLTSGFAGC